MKDVELYHYFSNEATPEEVDRIERWLEEDCAHQREFDAAHMLFNAMTLRTERFIPMSQHENNVRMGYLGRIVRIAAAIILIVGAGYTGSRIEKDKMERRMSESMQVIEVPAGQRMDLTLADGTSVCMNGNSRLEYPLVFARDQRKVKISGEAFFKVAHDAEHPFTVETFASEIEVLGTEFNVIADSNNNCFSTTLVNGSIRISNLLNNKQTQIVMNPDEMVRLINGRLFLSKVNSETIIAWTKGYINVSGVAFRDLMRQFERVYGVDIRIERANLPTIGYASGKIRISEGVDFALHLLQLACDFSYTKDETTNTIIIR